MTLAYADEKFSKALRSMAIGRGRINERLTDAFVHHLSSIDADRDVPDDLSDDFRELMARATIKAPERDGEGRIHASIRALSEDEAVEMAGEIYALAYQVEQELIEQRSK